MSFQKSRALSELLIDLADDRLAHHGFTVASPQEPEKRGSQVSLQAPRRPMPCPKALRAAGVVADFRNPDILTLRHHAPLHALRRCMGCGGGTRGDHGYRELDGAQDRDTRRGHLNGRRPAPRNAGQARRGVFPHEAFAGAADQPGLLDPDALLRVLPPPGRFGRWHALTVSAEKFRRRGPRAPAARWRRSRCPCSKTRYISASSIPPRRCSAAKTGGGRGQRVEPHADPRLDPGQVEEAVAGDVRQRVHRHLAPQQV